MVRGAAAVRGVEPAAEASDAELVRAVRGGGADAFALLVRRHRGRLRSVVRAVVRDQAEAEDVVQQAFLQAFAGLSSWSGTAPFWIWLARIATNDALMRLRRSRRLQAAAVLLAAHEGGLRPDPEQEAATREEMARVTAALPRLAARHREILQLASLSDLSRADVAQRLGVSEGAVKVRLHRARAALRGMLREPAPRRPRTPPLVLARRRQTLIGCGQHRRLLLD